MEAISDNGAGKEPTGFLSTGSTLLNLALSDSPFGGFMKGKYYFLVGDSTSGKTFFSMTCFAEACQMPSFSEYRLIYDNVEDGMLMDVERLFGAEAARRVEPPASHEGEAVHSATIEEFYYHLDDAIKEGQPFVYVLDSMDGLSSDAEGTKFEEQKRAHRAGKDAAGSYGDGKAKSNSAGLRKALAGLRRTGSILIIIAQTRDAIGAGPFQPRKTRSGGHALRFYATAEIWTALGGKITKTIRGRTRKVGDKIKLNLRKNRVTGKLHEVWVELYPSFGIDDLGSCVDYLLQEGWWKKAKQTIKAKEFGLECTKDKLVREIEQSPRKIRKLRRLVAKCWRDIEEACAINRQRRYE